MKQLVRIGRWVSVIGFVGCVLPALIPFGCANTVTNASIRYRARHGNRGLLIPDITVERLQACVEEYGAQLEQDSLRVGAIVQVDQDGQTKNVRVNGIPETALDFETCATIALRDMVAPASVFNLRPDEAASTSSENTAASGNELANPIVVVEVLVALGEFAAEHAGRVVLYTVTIEVLSAAAVAGAMEMVKRNRWRKNCTDGYVTCMASPAGLARGNNWNERRCASCRNVCDKDKGSWPATIQMFPEGTVSCY